MWKCFSTPFDPSGAFLRAYIHIWCTPLITNQLTTIPYLTPWVLQWVTASHLLSVLIFSKGQHVWMLIKFEQLVLVHLSWPENLWGKTDMMFRINATDGKHWGKTELSTGNACVSISDPLIAVEILSVNCTFSCPQIWNWLLTDFFSPWVAATDLFSSSSHCVGWCKTDSSTYRKRGMRQREDESYTQGRGNRGDVLPHPALLSDSVWPPRLEEFITIAVHTSARHCLHIKVVIVVNCLFPSGKKNKTT